MWEKMDMLGVTTIRGNSRVYEPDYPKSSNPAPRVQSRMSGSE